MFPADENLILKLFMFRPQNLLEKLRKCLCCSHFCSVLDALKLVWEILERHQIFSRYSTPCIFSLTKCLTYYFILQRCLKQTIFSRFRPFFWALNLVWEILKNLQIFKRCFKFVLSHLQSYRSTIKPKNAKTANVWLFPLIFGSLETGLETLKKYKCLGDTLTHPYFS